MATPRSSGPQVPPPPAHRWGEEEWSRVGRGPGPLNPGLDSCFRNTSPQVWGSADQRSWILGTGRTPGRLRPQLLGRTGHLRQKQSKHFERILSSGRGTRGASAGQTLPSPPQPNRLGTLGSLRRSISLLAMQTRGSPLRAPLADNPLGPPGVSDFAAW